MGSGKPRGIRAARHLKSVRRKQRWADKGYKKAHGGTALKANPFGGSSHAKGIVIERLGIEAKQPNSAIRKCVRVQLVKNGKKVCFFILIFYFFVVGCFGWGFAVGCVAGAGRDRGV